MNRTVVPRLLLAIAILFSTFGTPAAAQTQSDPVEALLDQMSPEQKIGQLFITTFADADGGPDSDIGKLITEHYVSGVVLLAVSENFTNNESAPRQVATLSNQLQERALSNGLDLPLFIAIDEEGDGFPYNRLTGGLTEIPNPMAIGATWNPDNSRAIGEIVGKELAAVGINLLLGPDADVLNNPRPLGRGDIGTRTFGGDPWWVAQMAQAYTCGVHAGGAGKVATVAKHFPGHGGSDRLPDREVATVDKSLTELKRIELPPFFAATDMAGDDDCGVTDAMMTSHIRYRGLAGNIRQFTAPISFDAEGLGSILGLNEFSDWRDYGMMVSDALGVEAVGKYFDPTEQTFPHRQIAKEALMAGNDLLIISEFSRPRASSLQMANLIDTMGYFRDEYGSNAQFRQRVEEAVRHILQVKLRLYPNRETTEVMIDPELAIDACGNGLSAVSKIAREAITLLSPSQRNLPEPPRRDEDIVIFTDAQEAQDCLAESCPPYQPLPLQAVQDEILRLYGPNGTGQIDPERIHSVSFADLKDYVETRLSNEASEAPEATPEPKSAEVGALLDGAEWIIFAMRNVDRDTSSDAVRIFLDNGVGQIYKAKIVVLAFNAPYYLDTTEINKLSLYLAAYSKMTPFVEASVRALFGEFVPAGHSPVNVEGVNYDLLRVLAPDENRPIELSVVDPVAELVAPVTIRLRAGPLLDQNGNRVPDGTEITFEASYVEGNPFLPPVSASVVDGIAEATFHVRQQGAVSFSARSGEAHTTRPITVTVQAPPTPTAEPTHTATPESTRATSTFTPTVHPTDMPQVNATEPPGGSEAPSDGSGTSIGTDTPAASNATRRANRLLMILYGALGTALATAGGLALFRRRYRSPEIRTRVALLSVMGGMGAYCAYLLLVAPSASLPGLAAFVAFLGGFASISLARGARQQI